MLDCVACGEERHRLLNILGEMCSHQRMVPKSMQLDMGLTGEMTEEHNEGYAVVFRAQHNGRPVAVKTMRIHLTSDFDKCLSVNTLIPLFLGSYH
jgi:hypothetical protein